MSFGPKTRTRELVAQDDSFLGYTGSQLYRGRSGFWLTRGTDLRRRRHESAGEHYRLGACGVSEALWAAEHFEVGYLPLHIRASASSGVPDAVCSEFEAGVAANSDGS